jgi:glutamate-5-semialdehyde dehydrogenase
MAVQEIKDQIIQQALLAKAASRRLAGAAAAQRNEALLRAAEAIVKGADDILFKNEIDVEAAKEAGLAEALIDRLTLNEKRLKEMAQGLSEIAALPDPLGEVIREIKRPNGLVIQKVSVPLGVISMIYESRPNVTVEASGLALKAGNAIILRGGREAVNSNAALAKVMDEALQTAGLPPGVVQVLASTDRQSITELLQLKDLVDVVIARGSEEMIREIAASSSVPVLGHGKGTCHVYVDESADLEMARKIAFNAKVQRPGVCNAMETLLVHRKVADKFLPALSRELEKAHVEIRGDEETRRFVPSARPAKEEDWPAEYLDLILAIRVVGSLEEAIDHINRYGSSHTDAIVTREESHAQRFLREVDSACVMVNASTRLHDGGAFGLGAEIGISTGKLHARGTMGLRELTSTKYVVRGSGQVRE